MPPDPGCPSGIDDLVIIPQEQGHGDQQGQRGGDRASSSSTSTARSPTASATTRSSPSGRTSPRRSPTRCSSEMSKSSRPARRGVQPRSTSWPTPAPGAASSRSASSPGMRGLMAKPSGEIIETPDHLELPRGAHGAAVLHLDARRPQGAGRHGPEDRRLRLSDPTAGGRGPGRHHLRGSTAARSTASRRGHRRERRDHRAAARPHHRPRVSLERIHRSLHG